jgi:hypothetical protein
MSLRFVTQRGNASLRRSRRCRRRLAIALRMRRARCARCPCVSSLGTATLLCADGGAGASDVLLLLRVCFVPAVRDVLAFGRSAGQRYSAQSRRRLALAAPALGAPRVLCARCARCPYIWSLGGATLLRAEPATSCPCCSRPRSSVRASCPLCAMSLHLVAQRGNASPRRSRRCRRRLAIAAPALGDPCVCHACCARCSCVWSLGVGDAPPRRSCGWSARSCCGRSRPGSSTGASCPLCAMWLHVVNLSADVEAPLGVGDVLSAQIAQVVGEACRGCSHPGSSVRASCPL